MNTIQCLQYSFRVSQTNPSHLNAKSDIITAVLKKMQVCCNVTSCWQVKWLTNLPKECAGFIFGFKWKKWWNVLLDIADVRTALLQYVGNYLPLGSTHPVTNEFTIISSYITSTLNIYFEYVTKWKGESEEDRLRSPTAAYFWIIS
jgi:hypothetical protein